MKVRIVLAALLLAGLGAVTLPASAEPVTFTKDDVGFSEGAATAGLVDRLDAMDAYVGAKKPMLRLDLDWWKVQDCATCPPDFAHLRPIVDAAHERGMPVLLILAYSPPWATGGRGDKFFPADDAAWRRIVDATVAEFKGKVQAYEVWNEPNLTAMGNYGDGSVGARRLRYWQLTRIAYERVHAGCADCTVLAGASAVGDQISASRNDNESAQWLQWAYANGYGTSFDAVAHHPYPAWNSGLGPSRRECTTRWWNMFGPPDAKCGELAAVRDVMVRNGDSAKKIWGTEFGYPSAGDGITKLAAATVRDHLEEGIRMWRALDYTGPLFLYSFRDTVACTGNSPECHFGLTDTAGRPKQPMYDDVATALNGTLLPALATGRSLHRQSALRSADGRFHLWLQGDGNLVLYRGSTVLWARTGLKAVRLTNQADGNLALFDGTGKRVWASGTAGKGASRLLLQPDGNLVLYPAATPARASWSTGTYGR